MQHQRDLCRHKNYHGFATAGFLCIIYLKFLLHIRAARFMLLCLRPTSRFPIAIPHLLGFRTWLYIFSPSAETWKPAWKIFLLLFLPFTNCLFGSPWSGMDTDSSMDLPQSKATQWRPPGQGSMQGNNWIVKSNREGLGTKSVLYPTSVL